MIVSHNELVGAVNKAFIGMKRACGEPDIIANMVADLQMVGLYGVEHFNKASAYIKLESDLPTEISMADNIIKANLHNRSLPCHFPVIIDYAIDNLSKNTDLTIKLSNCHNRWLAYSELAKLKKKGISCTATWNNGSNPECILYISNKNDDAPDLFFYELSDTSSENFHDITISLSINDFDKAHVSKNYKTHIDAKELIQAHQKASENGIFVEDSEWLALKKVGTAMLVENSDKSEKGAGE